MSPCPPAIVIPCRSRSASRSSTASIPGGVRIPVRTAAVSSSGRVELEAHRLRARPAGAADRDVAGEDPLEALLEDEAERCVERDDDRRRRRERACCPSPGRRAGAPSPSRSAASVDSAAFAQARSEIDGEREAGRCHQRLLRAGDDDVDPQASVSSGTAPRLEIASTTEITPASLQAAASCSMSETTPVDVSEWTRKATPAPLSARRARDVLGLRRLAPRVVQRDDVAAVGGAELLPARAELSVRDDERLLAGRDQVREGRLVRARAGGGEEEDLVLGPEDWWRRASDSRKTFLKSGERWWMTGSASAASTSGGTGVGPGVRR